MSGEILLQFGLILAAVVLVAADRARRAGPPLVAITLAAALLVVPLLFPF